MSLLHEYEDREYDLTLEAFGRGIVEDAAFSHSLEEILQDFRRRNGRDPIDVSYIVEDTKSYDLDYWFTAVAPGYLEQLPTLKELVLSDTVESVGVTPALEKLLRGNKTLIRGPFDSYAESFAGVSGLPFRPADLVIARHELESVHEITGLTLIFRRDGSCCIREDIHSPGSSASHSFGGTFLHELPRAFYRVKTAQQVAAGFRTVLEDAILEDGRLADFIAKAREKDKTLFWRKNRW